MSRTERIMVRLTPEEKEAAHRAAKANGRSVSNYGRWAMINQIVRDRQAMQRSKNPAQANGSRARLD